MHNNKKVISVWVRDDKHVIIYNTPNLYKNVFEVPDEFVAILFNCWDTDEMIKTIHSDKTYVTLDIANSYKIIYRLVSNGFMKSKELVDKYTLVSKLSR